MVLVRSMSDIETGGQLVTYHRGPASIIQRAYRSHRVRRGLRTSRKIRKKRIQQQYNRTRNTYSTSLGKGGKKKTTKQRLDALEVGAAHHHDYVSNTPETITWNGTTLLNPRNSYNGLLAIQGPLSDGTSGNQALQENEQRQSDAVFVKYVRIKGEVTGVHVNPLLAPTSLTTISPANAEIMKNKCYTKTWITLLVDKRPSTMGDTGLAQVNPLPNSTVGDTAICEPYADTVNNASLLQFFGPETALKSYDSTRFNIVAQQCIITTFMNPRKFFDIKYNINKKIKFVPPRTGTPSPANAAAVPYNYNLLVFFTSVVPVADLNWSASIAPGLDLLKAPILSKKTSRCYFTDTS